MLYLIDNIIKYSNIGVIMLTDNLTSIIITTIISITGLIGMYLLYRNERKKELNKS